MIARGSGRLPPCPIGPIREIRPYAAPPRARSVHDRWQANLNTSIKGDGIDRDFNASPTGKRVTLDGYTKVDLALAYRLLENAWGLHTLTLTAKVHNLFDEQYEEAFGFSSADANFLVGFQAEF